MRIVKHLLQVGKLFVSGWTLVVSGGRGRGGRQLDPLGRRLETQRGRAGEGQGSVGEERGRGRGSTLRGRVRRGGTERVRVRIGRGRPNPGRDVQETAPDLEVGERGRGVRGVGRGRRRPRYAAQRARGST